MPKYLYRCNHCDALLELYHTMSESIQDCTECGTANSLVKKPSSFNFENNQQASAKTGEFVKKSIEEFKEDLLEQKEELKRGYVAENE